jgi:hypothetical protein
VGHDEIRFVQMFSVGIIFPCSPNQRGLLGNGVRSVGMPPEPTTEPVDGQGRTDAGQSKAKATRRRRPTITEKGKGRNLKILDSGLPWSILPRSAYGATTDLARDAARRIGEGWAPLRGRVELASHYFR